MYCGKCGAQNPDNVNFCNVCGAPMGAAPTGQQAAVPSSRGRKASQKRNRQIGMITTAIAVVLILVLTISLFGGRSYRQVAMQFMDASLAGDGETLIGLLPEEYVEQILEDSGYTRERYVKELSRQSTKSLQDLISDYVDMDYSYEVTGAQNLPKEELKDKNEDYKEYGLKISAGKTVVMEMKISGELYGEEYSFSQAVKIPVIKCGGEWYLDVLNYN